ncbi:hypothetical protein F5884DRAFT_365199 [Xylogone sp. PMI_703]|nr:hypothetical protein F5884DRAFT_365199 [Xylogone sp. PMI_703]
MASSPGIWAPIAVRVLRHAFKKTSKLIKARISEVSRPINTQYQPVLVRVNPRQPVHPAALLRQGKGRWYTTHSTINASVRRFLSYTRGSDTARYAKSSFPPSATASSVSRLTSRAPFASTLRPNLTGGAIPRTAGGYTIGGSRAGGARYFSHSPALPAEVVNNVSQAVRAFWLSGQRAQFDGVNTRGEKRYRKVTQLQQQTGQKLRSVPSTMPGSYIDFSINPTVTALSPLAGLTFPFATAKVVDETNLNTEGFLDVLSIDFSRALKDLAATMNDLKKLAALGDLPVSLEQKSLIRVRFPGCDAETVERLCDEVGVQRGIIHEDVDFNKCFGGAMALMFPYAPSCGATPSSPGGSVRSEMELGFDQVEDNPWLDDIEGYESMEELSPEGSAYFTRSSLKYSASDYEGLEGIYRFIEECDNARRM